MSTLINLLKNQVDSGECLSCDFLRQSRFHLHLIHYKSMKMLIARGEGPELGQSGRSDKTGRTESINWNVFIIPLLVTHAEAEDTAGGGREEEDEASSRTQPEEDAGFQADRVFTGLAS